MPRSHFDGRIRKWKFHPENASVEKFENTAITSPFILDLRLRKVRPGKSQYMVIVRSSFSKSSVFEMFSVHRKFRKDVGIFKFLQFQERFLKVRFRYGRRSCVFKSECGRYLNSEHLAVCVPTESNRAEVPTSLTLLNYLGR